MNDLHEPTLATLVTENPAAARVFERHGLDYCCHGQRSLTDACRDAGLDVDAITQELAKSAPNVAAPPSDDPVERLRQRATAMTDTGAALKKLADATDPLYKSLDENQKRRFAILNRLGGTDRDGFRGRDGGGRDGDGMRHHWGPRRTNTGPTDMEQPGGQRL